MIPLNTELSGDPKLQRLQSMQNYQQLANVANGRYEEYTPKIVGGTSGGAATYTTQRGYFLRRGIDVDAWFALTWTGHTGTGNLRIELPFIVENSGIDIFTGTVSDSNITYAAGRTHLVLAGLNNTLYTEVQQSGSGVARQVLAISAAGTLVGHLRYIAKRDLSRR